MKNRNIIFVVILIILGILFRTVWHLGPNVEFVTAATLLAASYIGGWWVFAVPLLIMLISDFLIGNTNIFIFTWSAYLVMGIVGKWGYERIKNYELRIMNNKIISKIFFSTGFGVLASAWFYVWTNFGVWLLDSWEMYPKTLTGLIDCYILAIPFFKYNLIGNLLIVPVSFTVVELVRLYILNKNFLTSSNPLLK